MSGLTIPEAIEELAAATRDNAAATREWIALNERRLRDDAPLTAAYLEMTQLNIRKLRADLEMTQLNIRKLRADVAAAEARAEAEAAMRDFMQSRGLDR